MNACAKCGLPGGAWTTHVCLPPTKYPPVIAPIQKQVCPVCGGRGLVVRGFYDFAPTVPSTSSNDSEQCRTCGGRGIV